MLKYEKWSFSTRHVAVSLSHHFDFSFPTQLKASVKLSSGLVSTKPRCIVVLFPVPPVPSRVGDSRNSPGGKKGILNFQYFSPHK